MTLTTQDNPQLVVEVGPGDGPSASPAIADLESITNVDCEEHIFEQLDLTDGDGYDSNKDGKEVDIDNKVITKSPLHCDDHSDDLLAYDNVLSGDSVCVLLVRRI